jgi:putative flippase GtrA
VSALARQGWRFLLVGGTNTALTFVVLAVLAEFLDRRVAFTIAFVLGLAYAAAFTGRFVFGAAGSRARTAAFVAWYLGVYLAGLLAVQVIGGGDRSGIVVALAAICVTAPLGFLGGRIIYSGAPRLARRGKGASG